MARGNQSKANTGLHTFIDLPVNNTPKEKSSKRSRSKKVYGEEEEEYVSRLLQLKVTLTLINVFWFIIFFVTLFSPFLFSDGICSKRMGRDI